MSERNWQSLGCAVIIGAAVAFPAGVMFAGHEAHQEKPGSALAISRPPNKPFARNVYSPSVLKDPYVLDQHRRVVEALEAQCRKTSEHCAEAVQARQWLDRQRLY